jgi:hypothetical protein
VSDNLKAGDIAIVLPNPNTDLSEAVAQLERYNGEEVLVEKWCDMKGVGMWQVRPKDGFVFWCSPALLRKKKPPQKREELGDWRACPWRPGKVRA